MNIIYECPYPDVSVCLKLQGSILVLCRAQLARMVMMVRLEKMVCLVMMAELDCMETLEKL